MQALSGFGNGQTSQKFASSHPGHSSRGHFAATAPALTGYIAVAIFKTISACMVVMASRVLCAARPLKKSLSASAAHTFVQTVKRDELWISIMDSYLSSDFATLFVGYFVGLFEGHGQGNKKRGQEEPGEERTQPPVIMSKENNLLKLSLDENNQLRLEAGWSRHGPCPNSRRNNASG